MIMLPLTFGLQTPDLNPMNYHTRGVIKRKINKLAQNTKDSLKAVIGDVMANMKKEHLINALF